MQLSSRKSPWLVCLLPFAVFMAIGSLEPTPPTASTASGESSKPWIDLGIEYRHYPLVYSLKIALTVVAMIYVGPGYGDYRAAPHWKLSLAVGLIGAAIWIGLAAAQHWLIEKSAVNWLKSFGQRSAFNPLDELSPRPLALIFLAVRFFGLVLVVPTIEEFFLRGFAMRFAVAEKWWEVPIGSITAAAAVVGTILPVLMHPQEAMAAFVWFSMITWLMIRTRSVWSCILAHAITNLTMGIYVLASGQWWLM
jgi:CAAX prenyl protease-like protein